jgi:GH15 family glucan-1,4-alpha-glucosidase
VSVTAHTGLDLALIGNCSWGGLVDRLGRLVWACLPRFDSDPLFPALLRDAPDGDGSFAVELLGCTTSEQRYDGHTPVLVTTLRDGTGNAIELRDFAPRFANHGRTFRPTMMIRRVRPVAGEPRVRVTVRPRFGYGAHAAATTRGSNHLRFVTPDLTLRLTTNAPITYVANATSFVLEQPLDLILGPDESLAGSISATAREFDERTCEHWLAWARALSIPFEWQAAVIRAAIALELCHFEETGAIVAALTTSIPEAPGTTRNWDYRYCWLRDAHFVIQALNRLGATRTMESFLSYIENLAMREPRDLQPVYGIAREETLSERIEPALPGFLGMGPVRVGNQAYVQPQHDVYGSLVLATTHSFFDERLAHRGGRRLFGLLERYGALAFERWDRPDAGLWELRTRAEVHTFSGAMCWAACDRLARIALRLGLAERAAHWRGLAERIRGELLRRAWCESRKCFAATLGGEHVDASLLLFHELGIVAPDDPRFLGTLAAIEQDLRRGPHLLRYAVADDFGAPTTSFNVCTFWYIAALAATGRREEARELFGNMLALRNRAGLLSEDVDPATGALWGNFPQTYSMVGLIHCATRLSKSWDEAF